MIIAVQLLKRLDAKYRQLFIDIFNDLSFEIEEMGYKGMETELIADILLDHFWISIDSPMQLQMLTDYILKHQKDLDRSVKGICLMIGTNVA